MILHLSVTRPLGFYGETLSCRKVYWWGLMLSTTLGVAQFRCDMGYTYLRREGIQTGIERLSLGYICGSYLLLLPAWLAQLVLLRQRRRMLLSAPACLILAACYVGWLGVVTWKGKGVGERKRFLAGLAVPE
ncbi:hypothetical protein F4805DRAFT_422141 [Annulohypoxylon moriforme]|nr:hypothetical protein F4805DRAFT_422141 [Annulohypoxylon moriforme]